MHKSSLALYSLALITLVSLSTCRARVDVAESVESVNKESGQRDLIRSLRDLGIKVQEVPSDHQNTHINSTYILHIQQPIDHTDEGKGYFEQKVYLSHTDTLAPMVMYLSGYAAGSNKYMSEPAYALQANQIHVEHRFFADSKPKGEVPYKHLTIPQAAADHHRIVQLLSQVYGGPWLNTGISKGGQTTMYHRYFYPEDVTASVVYVAPINQAIEDKRIYDFLDQVGTEECRKRVLAYQMELLLNYGRCLDLFEEKTKARNYDYGVTLEQAFELSIYEYGFAFWQWSADCDAIPVTGSSFEAMIDHLFLIDAPGFFTRETMTDLYPFFYQSYTEMGMYGYQVDQFGALPREYPENFSNYRTFIPADQELEYDGTVHHQLINWLDSDAEDIVFIYGEYDPWSATGYEPSGANNLFRYTIPEGNHASRLGHLGDEDYQRFTDSLHVWLHN